MIPQQFFPTGSQIHTNRVHQGVSQPIPQQCQNQAIQFYPNKCLFTTQQQIFPNLHQGNFSMQTPQRSSIMNHNVPNNGIHCNQTQYSFNNQPIQRYSFPTEPNQNVVFPENRIPIIPQQNLMNLFDLQNKNNQPQYINFPQQNSLQLQLNSNKIQQQGTQSAKISQQHQLPTNSLPKQNTQIIQRKKSKFDSQQNVESSLIVQIEEITTEEGTQREEKERNIEDTTQNAIISIPNIDNQNQFMNKLIILVQKCRHDWKKIANRIGKPKLTPNILKQFYMNHRKKQKTAQTGKFTTEEDLKILNEMALHGFDWEKISQSFPNRTAIQLKNRYYSKLRRV